MSDNDKEVPPTRKEKAGNWLCAIGWVVFLVGCIASYTSARVSLMLAGAVSFIIGWRLAPGMFSSDKPDEASDGHKPEPIEPVDGPEDDCAFMETVAQRADLMRNLPTDPFD